MNRRNLIIGIVATLMVVAIIILARVGSKSESRKGSIPNSQIAVLIKEAESSKHSAGRIKAYKEIIEEYSGTDAVSEVWYRLAKAYEEQDQSLNARDAYQKIVDEYPDSAYISQIKGKLEDLNMKVLFSPAKMDESIEYEIISGDSLGKIAKKFNTTVELIMKSNRLTDHVIRTGKKLKIVTGKFSIVVDKSQTILILKLNGKVLKTYPISTGLDNSTPVGRFTIVTKLVDPVWYKAGAVVPSGSPNNILGTRWMGISEMGYGIHGTTEPGSIGRQITAGCVRMYNKDVEELYTIVPRGAEVIIVE